MKKYFQKLYVYNILHKKENMCKIFIDAQK